MKIAIISDTHLGYARFEDDAAEQAESAFLDAAKKADLILYAGDVFDVKVPRLETLWPADDMRRNAGASRVPIYAIHGNHERRSKDMVNPVQLLATVGVLNYLHASGTIFEKNNERIFIFGMGSVPEDLAATALKTAVGRVEVPSGMLRILMLHQTIKDFSLGGEDDLTMDEISGLPFDLIVNGHIHKTIINNEENMLIPGSTVITQLKEDETAPRGYILYDTSSKKPEFVEIPHRKFLYAELKFSSASMVEVRNVVIEKLAELKKLADGAKKQPIIRIKLSGTLKEGIRPSDLFISADGAFIDNQLNRNDAGMKLSLPSTPSGRTGTVTEIAISLLRNKIGDKMKLLDPAILFDKVSGDVESAAEYVNSAGNSQ